MRRIITAAVILPFLIASILVPWLELLFVFLAAAAMVLALAEFWKLAMLRGMKPEMGGGYLASVALFLTFYYSDAAGDLFIAKLVPVILIVFTAGTLIAFTIKGAPFDKLLASAGATILGVLYVVLLGGYLVAVRTAFSQNLAAHLLSFFFLVIFGSDTGAYYVGRAFGKHKLAAAISPGKTWEGVFGGLAAALALATLAHFWFFRALPLKWALPLAVLMTIIGIAGDLTESALKRGSGSKDAATILPGHGGLLDRLDSLLFNAPVIYYFGRLYFG
ncbi:MAG TPA: phosphatidate cytidylyltransferase [Pyrinomonadaceae bacterium]|nr:phosphatidate cytidylyltransferase [Pyrinomonadaceae bacterium]